MAVDNDPPSGTAWKMPPLPHAMVFRVACCKNPRNHSPPSAQGEIWSSSSPPSINTALMLSRPFEVSTPQLSYDEVAIGGRASPRHASLIPFFVFLLVAVVR